MIWWFYRRQQSEAVSLIWLFMYNLCSIKSRFNNLFIYFPMLKYVPTWQPSWISENYDTVMDHSMIIHAQFWVTQKYSFWTKIIIHFHIGHYIELCPAVVAFLDFWSTKKSIHFVEDYPKERSVVSQNN